MRMGVERNPQLLYLVNCHRNYRNSVTVIRRPATSVKGGYVKVMQSGGILTLFVTVLITGPLLTRSVLDLTPIQDKTT